MEIFIQSSGRSPDFGYCWQPEVPPYLTTISKLIQSESPSVVLARFQGELILLTTGLESPEKKDFRDRPIRHSVCWRCSDNDYDEKKIRAIAVLALRGLLSVEVDKYIHLGGENGFEASFSELKSLSDSFLSEIGSQCLLELEDEHFQKIGKNSQDLKNDIADKLQQYRLPKGYKFIIVATGIKAEKPLEEVGAWRSLSTLVKSENWRSLSKSEVQPQNFPQAAIVITVAAIMVVALILLVILLHPFSPKPEVTPSPNPTTSPTQQTIEQTFQNSLTHSPEPLHEVLSTSINSEIKSVPLEN